MVRWQDMDPEELRKLRIGQWKDMFREIEEEGTWTVLPLWEQGAPDFAPEYGQGQPRIALMRPQREKRGMLIVCAGGGFNIKSFNEAKPVAEYFHAQGFNAAVLDYRLSPYEKPVIIKDALRAVRLVRAKAEELNALPDRIAIGGFSAGGALSGYAGVFFDPGDPSSPDPVERVSSRPDAVLQIYGSFDAAAPHRGLNYDAKAQNDIARLSVAQNLRCDCPPFFLAQTASDDPRGVSGMAMRLAERGIPFESHIFMGGTHGNGLFDGKNDTEDVPHTAHWAALAAEWLRGYGF